MNSVSFSDLGVSPALVTALAGMDRATPFPIQADTLPDTLAGRDVLGRGKTGSGKTLAFAIPLVANLAGGGRARSGRPTGLVLAPTRELATQITATVEPLAKAAGLTVTTIFGGVKQSRQEQALRAGVDIVVACPGRLDDLMKQRIVDLSGVRVTVLDEADHMADLGFLPVVTRILSATPARGQRMLFSATLDNGVDKLVKRFMADPALHSVDPETSPVVHMTHHVFEVASTAEKNDLVQALASGTGRRILFTRTKHQAKRLAKQLTTAGIPARDLHGNLSQPQRDRNLAAFSEGTARVLVATDIAARGVHVDDVELVVHVDPPAEHKAYLHRSGRTARAGNSGTVATVMLREQRSDTLALLKKADISARPVPVTAGSQQVRELVGEQAPYVQPEAPVAPQQPARSGSSGRGRGGRGNGSAPRADGAGRSGAARGSAPRNGGGQRSGAGQRTAAGGAARTGGGARAPRRSGAGSTVRYSSGR
jgi:superfamily II DNA/RNA helicase